MILGAKVSVQCFRLAGRGLGSKHVNLTSMDQLRATALAVISLGDCPLLMDGALS
jgi:hypothetical protein